MPLISTFTRRLAKMPLLDLNKITAGLSKTWPGFLRDRVRSLRAGNYPETTRYNYLLAAAQLARYLGEYSPDPDADAAAGGDTVQAELAAARRRIRELEEERDILRKAARYFATETRW
jgi:hypothetical protein